MLKTNIPMCLKFYNFSKTFSIFQLTKSSSVPGFGVNFLQKQLIYIVEYKLDIYLMPLSLQVFYRYPWTNISQREFNFRFLYIYLSISDLNLYIIEQIINYLGYYFISF